MKKSSTLSRLSHLSRLSRLFPPLSLILCLALTSCVGMMDGTPDVTVAADRTEAGKKYKPPTAEKPQYYVLGTVGALELGAVYAGEETMPPREEVEPLIIAALEKQNFRLATNTTPKPALVIIYAWGSINPDELDMGDTETPSVHLNEGQILAIVSTDKDDRTPGSFDRNYNLPDITEGRHFLLIGAYDYATFAIKEAEKKKRTILWRAKLSVPNRSATLAQSIPTLLETGADFFGQDGPSTTLAGRLRKGTVEIGEAKIVEEDVRGNANADANADANVNANANANTNARPPEKPADQSRGSKGGREGGRE
jgi:hypothetical protein